MDQHLYIIDVETSGLDVARRDLWNLALVPFEGDGPPLNLYVKPACLQWDEVAYNFFKPAEAAWQAQGVGAEEAVAAVERYLGVSERSRNAITLAGHNVGFDLAFLNKLVRSTGRPHLYGVSHRAVDTHTLLWTLVGQGKLPADVLTSKGAFEHYGLDMSVAHTALGDAQNTRVLLQHLMMELGVSLPHAA